MNAPQRKGTVKKQPFWINKRWDQSSRQDWRTIDDVEVQSDTQAFGSFEFLYEVAWKIEMDEAGSAGHDPMLVSLQDSFAHAGCEAKVIGIDDQALQGVRAGGCQPSMET